MSFAVDCYLEHQAPGVRQLLSAARAVLLGLDERITEEFKWRVPFYVYHGPWCYLTTVPRQPYIHLGLIDGAQVADPAGRLHGENLKLVRHLRVTTLADLYDPETQALLQQALLLRDSRAALRRRS